MKWIVVGPGAVGGYFGGRLAASGEDVSFFARGRTLQALREHGLQVDSVLGNVTLPEVKSFDKPEEFPPADVVLVAVKGWQLEGTLDAVAEFARRGATILPLLNGVDAEGILATRVPRKQIMLGLCTILSTVVEPGHISHFGMVPSFRFGEIDNLQSSRAEKILVALKNAKVDAAIAANIQVALWEKFMFIAGLGSVLAAARATAGAVRSAPESRDLLERSIREIHTVGRASHVPLSDDAVARTLAFIDKLPPESTTSMQRDMQQGKRSELDLLTGSVVRLGGEKGIATPVHSTLYAVLLPNELAARKNN